MIDLSDRVALVTGAAGGIGRATTLALARAGADLVLASRRLDQLLAVVAEVERCGRRALAVPTDVTVAEQVQHWVDRALATFGRIDILVNCAGVAWRLPVEETTLEVWEQTIAVNLTGTFLSCRAVWPVMVRQGGGAIVNISSGLGRRGRALWSAYSASKFGVIGLTQCLAAEGQQVGIRVNAICPGPTDTPMRRGLFPGGDHARLQPPERVAQAVLWLLADEAASLQGQAIDVRPGGEETDL